MAPPSKTEVAKNGIPMNEGISVNDLLAATINRSQNANVDLTALLAGADVVEGRPLVDKGSMVGVPHILTSVSFRKGTKDVTGTLHDFVSCEFTTVTNNPVQGVYNDGSTGIRRQIVGYLASKGLIPETYHLEPDTAIWVAPEIEGTPDPTFTIRFLAPRGLRVSTYTNEFGDSQTYYLA